MFSDHEVSEQKQLELLTLVVELFCEGRVPTEIRDHIVANPTFAEYAKIFRPGSIWKLLTKASKEGLLCLTPPYDKVCTNLILKEHSWLNEYTATVVSSVSQEGIADRAAKNLLHLIRTRSRQRASREVHVGFAGGRTLRCVASRLAELLAEPHVDNPRVLYLHAMVAAFDDEDFYADPNCFITYFIGDNVSVDVKFKRLPLPGIVESDRFSMVRQLAAVDNVYRGVEELQIIVTSGSMWSDEFSTLREYFAAATRLKIGNAVVEAADLLAAISKHNVIGDMLWQPINSDGPVEVELPFTIPTLMRLRDLPKFIADGGLVLLVMGCSGVTRMPKSKLLKAILDLPSERRLCTHLVTDTATVRGMFQ